MSRPKPSGRSEAEIRRLMQETATRALEAEDEIYYHYGKEPTPFAENAALQALLNAGYTQTAGKLQVAGADTTQSAVKLKAAREELAAFTRATSGRVDSAHTSVAGFSMNSHKSETGQSNHKKKSF